MRIEKLKVKNEKLKIKKGLFLTSYFLLLAFCFLLLSLFASHLSLSHASDPKRELKEVQKKLRQKKQKVKQTIKKEKSILSELERINKTFRKKRKELKYFDKRLSETRVKIRLLENEIVLRNRKLKTRKNYLKERLKSLYKQQRGDIASLLVSARDYQDLFKRIKYISLIANYDSKLMKTYTNELRELNSKMKRVEILQEEYQVNKNTVKKKTKELKIERRKKDKLLSSIKSERSSYEKMIKELEASSIRLNKMIKELKKKKPLLIKGKGFRALKGRLPWPINGKILVPFGKHKDPEFNIPTFSKGIEIGTNIGRTVLAASGGRVAYADWFKGYGLLLIVNHGNGYHTLYAHLSEIFHKTGDIIKARQAVGKIGESGLLNKPSLYFEIRYKGKPLNPLKWLRGRKK